MKKILALVSAVLLLASCAKEAEHHIEMSSGEGAMRLGVAMQSDATEAQSVVVKIYKAFFVFHIYLKYVHILICLNLMIF